MFFCLSGIEFEGLSDINFKSVLKEFINDLPGLLVVYSLNNQIFIGTGKPSYVDKHFFSIPLKYRFKLYLNDYSVSESLDKLFDDIYVNLKLIEEGLFNNVKNEIQKTNRDSVEEFNKHLNESIIDLDTYSELLDNKYFMMDLESKLCRICDLFHKLSNH